MSRNALQELGVSLFTGPTGYKDIIARSTTQQFAAPNYSELNRTSDLDNNLQSADGKYTLSDFLNLFVFSNKYNVGTVIRALQTKGLFQSLAEPNLIASNGKEASFLAGGEYPYPVAQAGTNSTAVTIVFKEFGVRLSFTPTVLNGDLINLKVKPEVSSLDFANGVSLSGFRVPALSTRRTETEVELQDGQTFAIAGLMNNTVSSTMSKVPGIGDIPILGYLFRSRAYQKAQTELVVMITPQIIRRGSTGVSQGLPAVVEPYLGAPSKTMAQPAPYVGSPRYPAGGGGQQAPSRDETVPPAPATVEAPAQRAPESVPQTMQPAPRAAATSPAPEAPAPLPALPIAPAVGAPQVLDAPSSPAEAPTAAKPTKAEMKAREQQAKKDKEAAAAAAKRKAEEDKKAAKAKARQDKIDAAAAKRQAEAAKKANEKEAKRLEEQKKHEKVVAEAAARLKDAQAAYDRTRAGGGR